MPPTRNAAPGLPCVAEDGGFTTAFTMKYIRHKKFGFVLFEASIRHDDVARSLGGPEQVLSAGFVFAPSADLKCLGHSSSLNVGARPDDGAELRLRMGTY